jgi:hypothetical protein
MNTDAPTKGNYCGPKSGCNSTETKQPVVKTETGTKYHLEHGLLDSPICNPNREIDEQFETRAKAEKNGLEHCDSCFPGGVE